MDTKPFITKYTFHKDEKKETRILESVRVGGVYISRIIIRPRATVGNIYWTDTNAVFFVQVGSVLAKFVQPSGVEEKEFILRPDDGIVHVPPNVAFAMKNLLDEQSVVVAFSDRPLHDHSDDEPFQVLS